MGIVFKNIEYMNGGCFENLSGTYVPKSIGRGPSPGEKDCLITSRLRIFHLYGDVTIAGEGLQI
jgi:hypothetical protein